METTNYSAPMNILLELGEPSKSLDVKGWINYPALGLTQEYIPDLIRMATDHSLRFEYFDFDKYPDFEENEQSSYWAPIHAVRALSELHATSAIEPLLALLDKATELDDEWMKEDFPEVLGLIGPAALAPLAAHIADPSRAEFSRIYAMDGIEHIGIRHPEARDEAVQILMRQLEHFEDEQEKEEGIYEINGFLISNLVKLKAVEAAPLIERAFAADRVDEFIVGDWDDVQAELGLKSAEEVEEKRRQEQIARQQRHPALSSDASESHPDLLSPNPSYFNAPASSGKSTSKKKAKAKMAKASRNKNKRKK